MTETTTLTYCTLCDKVLPNPCVQGFIPDGFDLVATRPVAPQETRIIRARGAAELLTKFMACDLGRWMAQRQLSRQDIRGYVLYRLVLGVEHGITYQWPWGAEMMITAELVEEAFDGRAQEALPADTGDWRDEKIAYDRALADLMLRAMAGHIRSVPDRRWLMRFRLIDMARRVPSLDIVVVD